MATIRKTDVFWSVSKQGTILKKGRNRPHTSVYAAGFLTIVYESGTLVPEPLCSAWNIFQTIPNPVLGLSRMFGPHAAGSIIVHTIHAGRFLFDCTVSLTAVCGQQKESAVMVFILSKIKCFFRLLQSAALHLIQTHQQYYLFGWYAFQPFSENFFS